MNFCSNCGSQLTSGVKFCSECGTQISSISNPNQRQQEFDGKILKCSNCGNPLKSFEATCSTCGHELRGAKALSAVSELASKIETVSASATYLDTRPAETTDKQKGFFRSMLDEEAAERAASQIEKQKINLIKSFPVPNTKEDILEFAFLASSNVDTSSFGRFFGEGKEEELSLAWFSKFKHVYAKAEKMFGTEDDFLQIKQLYEDCQREINKQKTIFYLKIIIPIVLFVGFFAIMIYLETTGVI